MFGERFDHAASDGAAVMSWQPALGDTVRVVTTGRMGTVVHITLTEWGFLYDLAHGDGPGDAAEPERRTYATGELAPVESGDG